jgi:FMN reductase [NAD(P)H]
MIKTIIDRTSCRSYLSKPIELEKINQLKSVINSSPTARNIQDFSCVFVTDKTALEKLAIYADNQKHVAEAPLFIAFYADNNRPNAKNN